jgi:hypothetical protein
VCRRPDPRLGERQHSDRRGSGGEATAALFKLHMGKENALLPPVLRRAPGMSPAVLLQAMEEGLGQLDGGPDPAGKPTEELDVRVLPHGGGRHQIIFARLDALGACGRLVIINDHNPKPLRYQIDAAWPGSSGWEYWAGRARSLAGRHYPPAMAVAR